MEKGSFQEDIFKTELKTLEFSESEASQVPVPSQLPPALDISSLPSHVLRSGAVESLIQQNDDLMARLSVSLRRIAQLEEKLSQSETACEKQRFLYNNLKDQLMILQEKSRVIAERKERSEEEYRQLRERIRVLEIECAELYTKSKDRQEASQAQIQQLGKRIARYIRFHRRAKNAFKRLRSNLIESLGRIENLEVQMARFELDNSELKRKLTESTEYIQNQGKIFEADQKALVEHYESKLKDQSEEIKVLTNNEARLKEKINSLESLYDKNIELENRLVLLTRKRDEMRMSLEAEIEKLQQSLGHYRKEAKALALDCEQLKQASAEQAEQNEALRSENEGFAQQVESLQCLWKDNQVQLEKEIEKNKALQKLNQQLSAKLNEYRKDIQTLKDQLETTQRENSEKIKEMKSQFELTQKLNSTDPPPIITSKTISKIDNLIAEIQAGHSSKSP